MFLEDPTAARYGYELMKAAGLPSGTLYPMLARLEKEGLLTSGWDTPQAPTERPRKYYTLTGDGVRVVRMEIAQASMSARSRGPWMARPVRKAEQ